MAALCARAPHRRDGGGGDLVALAVHAMRGDVAGAHRLERAGPDMQGEESELDAAGAQALDERLVEMKPGGRRRDRARSARIDRLVTRLVLGRRRVRDVGRERHRAVALEHVEHLAVEAQSEQVALAPDDRGVDGAGEAQASPRLRRVARPDLRERLVGPSTRSTSTSTLPPESLTPWSRALTTRVSLNTSTSPADRSAGRSENA